ncbi:MAG TPA: class I SAM-dependent methyltransferase [Planctomycetota bacterium]|nr:class I SAM-dependent methyltransferase [Planctomycetota bacterium]
MPRAKSQAGRRRRAPLTAKTADKFDLYTRAVQAPDEDAAFMARYFTKLTGRQARLFREDFCGTAALACAFVKRHPENRAVGVDLDGPTLDWGRKHHVAALTEDQQRRIQLIQANVLDVRRPKVDALCALNFSYFIFSTRDELRAYFRNCRRSLVSDGVLFLDLWGGSETQNEQVDRRRCGGFTYLWDQWKFDPLTYRSTCRIHFEFKDGSKMRNAFVYEWRLWTPPELTELLDEAGFSSHHFLWEGTDRKTGAGNGVYRRTTRGTADRAWIAYLIARP